MSESNFLRYRNGMYEYDLEDYEGVESEFLPPDPNMPRKKWLKRMLKKIPLEHLPTNLRPIYVSGIQPPKFCFGFPLDNSGNVKLHEIAVRVGIAEFYTDADKEFVHRQVAIDSATGLRTFRPSVPTQTKRSGRPEDLDVMKTLKKLGEKIKMDLNIDCEPRMELVLDGAPNCIMPFVSFLTSYDICWNCEPEELNSRLANFLQLEESMKWYVHDEVWKWHVAQLESG